MAYSFTAASNRYLTTTSTPVDSGPITIACWANQSTSGTQNIVAIEQSSGSNRFAISVSNTGRAQAQSQTIVVQSSNTFSTNNWNHFCGIYDDAIIKRSIWLNGIGNITTTSTENTSGKNRINIGARTSAGAVGAYFDGRIAEVGIWNTALTAAEITSLAKGMTCDKVRPQSLVFYAPIVRDLIDQKGSLTITNNNGATVAAHPRVYA